MPPSRGPKPMSTVTRIRTVDESDTSAPSASVLLSASRQIVRKAPDLFPVMRRFPPPPSFFTPQEEKLIECARYLQDQFRYSGYHLSQQFDDQTRADNTLGRDPVAAKSRLTSSSVASLCSSSSSASVPAHHDYFRYSDYYKRVEGARNFLDEIPRPSPVLFPAELWRHCGWTRGATKDFMEVRQRFMSANELILKVQGRGTKRKASKVDRDGKRSRGEDEEDEDKEKDGDEDNEKGDKSDEEKEERDDDDSDEEASDEDDKDDMDGGDYTQAYADDDEDGADGFNDDEGGEAL